MGIKKSAQYRTVGRSWAHLFQQAQENYKYMVLFCQAPLSSSISWSLLKFMFIESVMLSNHLMFFHSFPFYLQSLPASQSFPMSQLFTSGSQNIGASALASVLPMIIQGWFPLGLIGLTSLLSKGLSRVFSSTTVWKHQFFGIQPFLWSNSHNYIQSNYWWPRLTENISYI